MPGKVRPSSRVNDAAHTPSKKLNGHANGTTATDDVDTKLGEDYLISDETDIDCGIRSKPGQWTNLYPWSLIPERLQVLWSLSIVVPIAPLMAVLIGSAEITWAIGRRIWNLLGLTKINEAVLAQGARLAPHVMRDKRDGPLLVGIAFLTVWAPSLFIWALWRYTQYGFEFWMPFVYHFLRIGPKFRFFAYQHVLLHKEGHSHRGLFKGTGLLSFLANHVCQWFIGVFYGQVPTSYCLAHNKIHHRYDNQLWDCHTNLDLDRSKPYSFLLYIPRFFVYWSNIGPLAQFVYRKEWKWVTKMALSSLYYYAVVLSFIMWDWKFGLVYLAFPFAESVVFFGGISYMWHAWVDPKDKENQYVLSVTILSGHDMIWGEDMHVVHHTSNCHWTEYEQHYKDRIDEYRKNRATIFRDTEEGEMLYWMLSSQWDLMAKHFVDLDNKLTHEEKKALILERLRYKTI